MYNSPYWFDTAHYWIDYPHLHTSRGMKYYYLMQMSFWFQQLYTIHTEKRRKDHLAMVTHHVVTLILLITSYIGNFFRVGNAVLCCMDVSDILLAVSDGRNVSGGGN
jgi:acyl-CoA-dependent ceramide synthase